MRQNQQHIYNTLKDVTEEYFVSFGDNFPQVSFSA